MPFPAFFGSRIALKARRRIAYNLFLEMGKQDGAMATGYGPAPMRTRTPWGDADTLRDRRLRPGPGVPREQVEQNQRERLYGAVVAVTTTKGYGETTVADLLEMAGVSRTTFYRYFATKEECFLATLDAILDAAVGVTASRIRRVEGSSEERAQRGLGTFVDLIVAQPAAARLCLVEAYAAGPAAIERVDEALDRFEDLVIFVLEQLSGREGMPGQMARAMVGSLRKIVHTRLYRHAEGELPELVPQLVELGLSYRPPPSPLRAPASRRQVAVEPGLERRLEPADRIERATMSTIAAKGYRDTTITDIATAAATSLSTFYTHFDGKAEAFEAALYSARLRMLAVTLPVSRRARSWPEAIRGEIRAALSFFESEPDFAWLLAVEVYAAGNEALARRDTAIEAVQRSIERGYEHAPGVSPIAGEAIASTLYSIFSERVRENGAKNLQSIGPLATYMVLAPFLGAEEACAIANGETGLPSEGAVTA
jgi:AcrR family transcriptional regulator